jgi:hypothetical protein
MRPSVAFLAALALASCREERREGFSAHANPRPSASAPERKPPPSPSGEELALLSPLAAGSELAAGFEVRSIHGVEDGAMRVVCAKDDATVRLLVALADPEGPTAPATAGKYAVYYSLRNAVPEDGEKLAQALGKLLEKHQEPTPPRGMTKFVPKEKPGTTL